MKTHSYIVITPVRNEEKYLPRTIASMTAQSVLPRQWIIVDDGSTDNTAHIAQAAALFYPWIEVVVRQDRGFRKPGGGVMEALAEGVRHLSADGWEYIVKLDGDLSFDQDYFEKCLNRFERDATLGIGGGTICKKFPDGHLAAEAPGDPPFHVRGATKIYKRACWEAIGSLIQAPGWDTVDEYKANMLGWSTYTFPELQLWHHRPAGGAEGTWKNWVKNGLANYVAGYHPLFMAAKCMQRACMKPYGVAAAGLLTGYLSGYFRQIPQVADREVIRYVRSHQMRRLCLRESLWDRKPLEILNYD